MLSHEFEIHMGSHFLRWIAEVIGIRPLMVSKSNFGAIGSRIDDSFPPADIILPCNDLSIEAASIRVRHAESERAEDASAMRSINSSC